MVRPIAVLVVVGGCRQILGIDDIDPSGGTIDAADSEIADAMLDARTCGWDALNIDSCALPAGGAAIVVTGDLTYADGVLGGMTMPAIDVVQSNGTTIEVVAMTSLQIDPGASITITSPTMVVFAIEGDVSIAGAIDMAGRILRDSETPGCSAADGLSDAGHGGGGNGTAGGDGGREGGGLPGGNGGPPLSGTLEPLHAGCPGHVEDAPYGDGGGAIEVTAGGTIVVASTGSIQATGQNGGRGVATEGARGGHGGGSGGSIVLDGDMIVFDGAACATGGGGGGGASGMADGALGGYGTCDGMAGLAGQGANNAGDGGLGGGAPGPAFDGDDAALGANAGGGGGGGGAGKIRLRGRNGVVLSPDAIMLPAPL